MSGLEAMTPFVARQPRGAGQPRSNPTRLPTKSKLFFLVLLYCIFFVCLKQMRQNILSAI